MTTSVSPTQTWRYTTPFAVLYVALATVASGLCLWLGLKAEPSWASALQGPGIEIVLLDWVARPIVLIGAGYFVATGAWTAFALVRRAAIVSVNDEWIEARSRIGMVYRLQWSEISDAVLYDGRIILSAGDKSARPRGLGGASWQRLKYRTLGIRLWNWRSVIINPAILDAAPDEIRGIIARRRPDLAVREL